MTKKIAIEIFEEADFDIEVKQGSIYKPLTALRRLPESVPASVLPLAIRCAEEHRSRARLRAWRQLPDDSDVCYDFNA